MPSAPEITALHLTTEFMLCRCATSGENQLQVHSLRMMVSCMHGKTCIELRNMLAKLSVLINRGDNRYLQALVEGVLLHISASRSIKPADLGGRCP